MASIIPGYEYDIFISYRQKDNKHDGWVTEFVNNLKGELESTFKEEISVYYDINPHDGLLETHDVDASLKDKLKCLVFIPIISRTYCDPKSFAWEHEFKAFAEQALKDQFGLKIKLPNGNVANRILPVRIHDLDIGDIKLCESILGGVLRGVEFIYSEPGVNRPLTPEDDVKINLNNIRYRNQVNKLANAINEIICGLKNEQKLLIEKTESKISILTEFDISYGKTSGTPFPETKRSDKDEPHVNKSFINKKARRVATFISLAIILSVIAIFLFSSGSTLPFSKRDWIIITDFENLTDNQVFDKSLYTAFSLTINQSRYINVFPRLRMVETMTRMEIKDKTYIDERTGIEVAIREGINICIVPSISEVGKSYVITAKILEPRTGNLIKSVIINAETQDDILSGLDQLSKKIRRDLGESRYRIAIQDRPLSKVTTSSLEALKQYSLGIELHTYVSDFGGAKSYYENALRIDTGFTAAKASLGNLMIERFDTKKGRELLNQAVKSIDNLTDKEKYKILAFHAVGVENDLPKGIEYTKKLAELYPDDPSNYNNLGWYYQKAGMFEEALKEYKTALLINPGMALTYGGLIRIYLEKLGRADSALVWSEKMISKNPGNAWGYTYLGCAYLILDSIKRAETAYKKARDIDPYFTLNSYNLALIYGKQGFHKEAIRILERILELNKNESFAYYDLGVNYNAMGNQAEAYKCFTMFKKIVTDEWIKKWPDDPETYVALSRVTAHLDDMDSSEEMLRKAVKMDSTIHDRFAEVLSLQGKIPEAINELEKALNNGYRNLLWLKSDPDLEILQYDIRFRNLLEKYFK